MTTPEEVNKLKNAIKAKKNMFTRHLTETRRQNARVRGDHCTVNDVNILIAMQNEAREKANETMDNYYSLLAVNEDTTIKKEQEKMRK